MKIRLAFLLSFLILVNTFFAQEQLGQTLSGNSPQAYWGANVDLSVDGRILAFSAPNYSLPGNGEIRVYEWSNDQWVLVNTIIAEDFDERIGVVMDMSDDGIRIVAGNPQYNGGSSGVGMFRVYDWNGTDWVKIGNTVIGSHASDRLGERVAISRNGERIAIKSSRDNTTGFLTGEIEIFELQGDVWELVGQPIIGEIAFTTSTTKLNALAFADQGNLLVVGDEDGNSQAYRFSNGLWEPEGNKIDTIYTCSDLAVTRDGSTVAISDVIGNGEVKVFRLENEIWVQVGDAILGDDVWDFFGTSLAISDSGDRLVIGATEYLNENGYVKTYKLINGAWELQEQIDGLLGGGASASAIAASANLDTIAFGTTGLSDYGFVKVYNFSPLTSLDPVLKNEALKIDVFPNPASQIISITSQANLFYEDVFMMNLNGQEFPIEKISEHEYDLGVVPSGMYYLKVSFADRTIVRKIMISN